MKSGIFPILAFERDNSEFVDNGTGFIINSDGYIITAGHVISNNGWKYYANIGNELYPIKEVYREYLSKDDQMPPSYKDLFIGRIDCQINQEDIVMFSEAIKKDEYYSACGYSSRNLTTSPSKLLTFDVNNENSVCRQLNYFELKY
ncbi:hypothetical protein [Marinifilum fragile]|uniref:hypothetical protein n=1 Tax=Marinifilum fragile TaxID=570161 RepID=UPI002AA72477|nr:hypothetical protein [Marinifilum fragile]